MVRRGKGGVSVCGGGREVTHICLVLSHMFHISSTVTFNILTNFRNSGSVVTVLPASIEP